MPVKEEPPKKPANAQKQQEPKKPEAGKASIEEDLITIVDLMKTAEDTK